MDAGLIPGAGFRCLISSAHYSASVDARKCALEAIATLANIKRIAAVIDFNGGRTRTGTLDPLIKSNQVNELEQIVQIFSPCECRVNHTGIAGNWRARSDSNS
jgi:hypothetical protein